jgi:DNA-binding NarL/FixJ family response regulator
VVREQHPDCVVLDYSMPKLDAPHAIERLTARHPQLKILVLTVHENVHYAVRALEAGAHGYMIKSAAVDELVEAIQAVSRGDVYISPKVSPEVWMQLRRPKRERMGLEALSQREFDVLRILGGGVSLQECAEQMKVSTSTVSTYRARILEKLNLTSTAELIRFAIENKVSG